MKTTKRYLMGTLLSGAFVASFVATSLLLQGCGGGGDTSSALPDFGRYEFYVATYVTSSGVPDMLEVTDRFVTFVGRYENGEFPTCPRVRGNAGEYTLDFGDGCYSPVLDERVAGQVAVVLRDARFNRTDGKLIGASEVSWRTNNLREADGSVTGSLTLRRRSGNNVSVSYNFDARASCAIRFSFDGDVTFSSDWFSGEYTVDGSGTYSAPATGGISYELARARYQSARCSQPLSGRVSIQAGGQRGTAIFADRRTCGNATVFWRDTETEFDFTTLSFDVCQR